MSSLKRSSVSFFVALSIFCLAASAFAQIPVPRLESQKAASCKESGPTDLTITYSRPGVKGRKIWADPLPEQAAKAKEVPRSITRTSVQRMP